MSDLLFTGSVHTIYCPDGKRVDIRETNGADDELLSKIKNVQDNTYYRLFLSAIIVMDYDLNRKPTVDDILLYKINTVWYLLFKQRLINHGPELVFQHACDKKTCIGDKPTEYTEDLSIIDGDLSSDQYIPVADQVFKYPLGNAPEHEFSISSQRKLKFDIMTGVNEKRTLEIPVEDTNKNTPCIIRNLKIYLNNQWTLVTSFAMFSSKEMSEIRSEIKIIDREFNPIIKFTHPKCGSPYIVPLFSIPAFFWPKEEI